MSPPDANVQRQPRGPSQDSTPATGGNLLYGAATFLFVVLAAGFFGSAPTFARIAFDEGMNSVGLQVFRFGITFCAVALVAVLFVRPNWRLTNRQISRLAAIALSTGIISFCYMTSVRHIQVGLASLIFFCFPIIVGVLTHFVGEERLTRRRSVAILIGFSGLVLVLGGNIGRPDPLGVALAFAAGCGVGFNFLMTPPLVRVLSPLVMTMSVTGLPFLFYSVLASVLEPTIAPSTPLAWVGVVGNGICYASGLGFMYATIRRLGAVRTAVFLNAEPLVSVLVAFLVLGEVLAPPQFAGAAVVLAGVVLMQWDRLAKLKI